MTSTQYAMLEIKDILKKYDLAALIVLHAPNQSEKLLRLDPGYSCMSVAGNKVKVRASLEKFNGDKEKRAKCIADTSEMLKVLTELSIEEIFPFFDIKEDFDKKVSEKFSEENK